MIDEDSVNAFFSWQFWAFKNKESPKYE